VELTLLNKQSNNVSYISNLTPKGVEHDFWLNFAAYFDADHTQTISLLELAALLEGIHSNATDEEIKSLVSLPFTFVTICSLIALIQIKMANYPSRNFVP
jgi:hypothetical protein